VEQVVSRREGLSRLGQSFSFKKRGVEEKKQKPPDSCPEGEKLDVQIAGQALNKVKK